MLLALRNGFRRRARLVTTVITLAMATSVTLDCAPRPWT